MCRHFWTKRIVRSLGVESVERHCSTCGRHERRTSTGKWYVVRKGEAAA